MIRERKKSERARKTKAAPPADTPSEWDREEFFYAVSAQVRRWFDEWCKHEPHASSLSAFIQSSASLEEKRHSRMAGLIQAKK